MSFDRPRVVIADDAVLIREGIRHLLSAGGYEIVGAVGSADELRILLADIDPVDAIVLDIRMPPTHTDEGMQFLEGLRATGSRIGVLLLSMYASPTLAIRAMSCGGGTGYLIKEHVIDGETLMAALETIMRGGTVVDPEVVAQLMPPRRQDALLGDLTERERDVLGLMAEGHSNVRIAGTLHLSPKTVETHVGHIMTKLEIPSTRDEHRRVLAVLMHLRALPGHRR